MDVTTAITTFLERHGVKSVVLADRILGCPHEEGIDSTSTATGCCAISSQATVGIHASPYASRAKSTRTP